MSTSLVKPLSPRVPCEQGYHSIHSVATWKDCSFKACSVSLKQSVPGPSCAPVRHLRQVVLTLACAQASSGDLVKTQTLIQWALGWGPRFCMSDVDLLVCGREASDVTQLWALWVTLLGN